MTNPSVERKVRQLDNDVQAIYEMLATISATQSRLVNRLNGVDQRLEEVGQQLEVNATRLTELGGKLDRVLRLLEQQ